MNLLTITFTSLKRIPQPEPLPDIIETPRQAFLAGWWGGICMGTICGASLIYILLDQIGRIK